MGTQVKFVPVRGNDTMVKNGVAKHVATTNLCISAMLAYQEKSCEELRFEDYQANRKFPTIGRAISLFRSDTSSTAHSPSEFGSTLFNLGSTPFNIGGTPFNQGSTPFNQGSTSFNKLGLFNQPTTDEVTTFKWRIDNFSTKTTHGNRYFHSEDFKLMGSEVKFYLGIVPSVFADSAYSTIYLVLKDLDLEDSVKVSYAFWVENTLGQKLQKLSGQHTFKYPHECNCDRKILPKSDLYPPSSNFIKEDDVVIICCELQHRCFTNPEVLLAKSLKQLSIHEDFRKKLWDLHEKGFTGDCTIQVQGSTFTVPKNILIAHSPVFERILTRETQSNSVEITDFPPEIVKAFIKYVHLGKIDVSDEAPEELLAFAEKYEVTGELKTDCIAKLGKTLGPDNILHRLIVAFTCDFAELKTSALQYAIDRNAAGNFLYILQSNEWCGLLVRNKPIADEITKAIFDKARWLA